MTLNLGLSVAPKFLTRLGRLWNLKRHTEETAPQNSLVRKPVSQKPKENRVPASPMERRSTYGFVTGDMRHTTIYVYVKEWSI